MTEQEWLQGTDPKPMLEFLSRRASDRRLRLFTCACSRRVWPLLDREGSREAVEVAERYADGQATDWELEYAARRTFHVGSSPGQAAADAHHAANLAACDPIFDMALSAVKPAAEAVASFSGGPTSDGWHARVKLEQEAQCGLLRCIFGNPFRPASLAPAWLTWHGGLLVSMGQRMYDSRDFSDMPVLADALEEAGCQDQDILGHCRSGGVHARGCWVVDSLLGKK